MLLLRNLILLLGIAQDMTQLEKSMQATRLEPIQYITLKTQYSGTHQGFIQWGGGGGERERERERERKGIYMFTIAH